MILSVRFPGLAWISRKGEFLGLLTTKQGDIILREGEAGSLYLISHKTLLVDTIRIPRFNNKGHFRITISPLSYDSSRNLVYLSNDYGIAQYQPQTKLMREISYREIFGDTTPNQRLLKFATDADGKIWLLKDQFGIRILDPERLKCVDSIPFGKKGLAAGFYTDVVGGGPGYMFLKGTHGIIIYNYIEQKSFLLDNHNGLSYPNAYSILYSNHHLLLGQKNKIEYFDTDCFLANNFNLQPALNTLMSDTTSVYAGISKSGDEIRLPYHKNTITLSFSAPEFVFPERVEYAYMLEGIDDGEVRKLFYAENNLLKTAPGHIYFY